MATKNRRIATYLPSEIDDWFKAFKSERSIEGDSQALLQILSEYSGVSQNAAYSNSPEILVRVENIEKNLSVFRNELFDEVKEFVLSILSQPTTNSDSVELVVGLHESVISNTDELPSSSKSESLNLEMVESLPDSGPWQEFQDSEISLLAVDLAKRLGSGQSTIANRKKDSPDAFAKWTLARDPDGLSWKFNIESGMFSPIGDVPADIKVNLTKKSLKGLTNGDLAKRLKIDGSTLSHWKKEKSSEEMLQEIRSRDPDGIGWILNKETGRFIEEPSDSPRMTQGELPEIVPHQGDDF
jgi:hypothetical protein